MAESFVGRSLALSRGGLKEVADGLAVKAPEIWAVISVETLGCGFLDDRRPQILFERHVFHALTGGQFDDGDISDPKAGGYGAPGAHQYTRLERALALDRPAAFKSTSWGLGQILGRNFGAAGFADVEPFVEAMIDSEDNQLAAMGSFIRSAGLDDDLQAHDWKAFARGYNGPAFAKNKYDVRLRGEFNKYATGLLPDLRVRTAQQYLRYLGFDPGPVDGFLGQHTRSAILDFQHEQGLPPTGKIDDALLAALAPAPVDE